MTALDKALAAVQAEIAALDADGADHYELDGRLARLMGKDLFWDSPCWEAGLPYAEQPSAAQEYYDGWVSQNLALRRSTDIKRAKAA